MAKRAKGPVNYAVVGLGHITQVAMLPAFAHARRNSRLAALVSDDATKLKTLSKKYRVRGTFSYADYDACLEGEATAVWRGLRSGSSPRQNGSSARVLMMTAAADLIRATVHNRVDNQVRGTSLANHRHRRSDRSRAVLPAVACRGATSRSAPATPSSLRRPCGASLGGPGVGDLFAA